jgi:hypothetical protein
MNLLLKKQRRYHLRLRLKKLPLYLLLLRLRHRLLMVGLRYHYRLHILDQMFLMNLLCFVRYRHRLNLQKHLL